MWIRITVCGRNLRVNRDKDKSQTKHEIEPCSIVLFCCVAIVYVCKSSRKNVIEARTEASSRRAFIGYIFLSTNNHPHLETNDFFTLLLFLFLFPPYSPFIRFDFRCENASFQRSQKINLESSNFKIDPPARIHTQATKSRSRKDAFENGETSRYLSSLHYTRQSFSTVSQKMDFFRSNDIRMTIKGKKKKKSSCVHDDDQTCRGNSIDSNNLVLNRKCLPLIDIHVTWEYVLGQCVSTFHLSPRSFLDSGGKK